jgi:FkbM family methyltransferase
MLKVKKNYREFYVVGEYSCNWFDISLNNGNWEEETFTIFDYFKNVDKIYLDIGAWIGPTVLYNSLNFKTVYCFEPDPIALERLHNNVKINNYKNIHIINKALSFSNEDSSFGGNGELGNSMSTLLVGLDNNEEFFNDYGRAEQFLSTNVRKQNIIKVQNITIETFINDYNIDVNEIGLIKMDIEGGEIVVIPAMKNFLLKHKPPLYISFHYVFLKDEQIYELYDILFEIYNSAFVMHGKEKKYILIDEAKKNRCNSLVFINI